MLCVFLKFQRRESLHQVPSEMTCLPGWEKMNCEVLWQQSLHQRDVRGCAFGDAAFPGGCASKETRNLILSWCPREREEPTYTCLSACTQWYPNYIIVALDSPKDELDTETVR